VHNQQVWETQYAGQAKSSFFQRVLRDAYGDDYPEDVEPNCFITKSLLVRMAQRLSLGPGEILADVGCGRGGPGLWLAREMGCDLVGTDYSRESIRQARQRIAHFGMEGHARFLVADMCATTLEDDSCDGAVCADAFFAQDKRAAVLEVARILRPGGRFALTWWQSTRPGGRGDSRLLQENGFMIEECYEPPGWRQPQLAAYEAILAEQSALIEEMGAAAGQIYIDDVKGGPAFVADRRRELVVGRAV